VLLLCFVECANLHEKAKMLFG